MNLLSGIFYLIEISSDFSVKQHKTGNLRGNKKYLKEYLWQLSGNVNRKKW